MVKLATHDQVEWLDVLAFRNNLNILALLNSNKDKIIFKSIWDAEASRIDRLCEFVTLITNDRSKIKKEWQGYESNWNERN